MKNIRFITVFTLLALVASTFALAASAQTAPTITTGDYVFTGARNVEVDGLVNPSGLGTQIWFQLSTDSSFSQVLPSIIPSPSYVSGQSGSVRFIGRRINLLLDTTYYYRAVGQNSAGIVYGNSKSFRISSDGTTSSSGSTGSNNTSNNTSNSQGMPAVTTNGSTSITTNSVTLNGSVHPNNTNTTFWFEFGTGQSTLNQATTIQSVGNGNVWQPVSGNLSGLENGRTYYYRLAAQNSYGVNRGNIMYFMAGNSQISGTVQTSGSTGQSNGQVLGNTSTGTSNGTATNGTSKPTSTSTSKTSTTKNSVGSSSTAVVKPANQNPTDTRPSFASLEYSIGSNGALVLVAEDAKPMPGEEFSYTLVYKNETGYPFRDARLKVIIPSEAVFVDSSMEPVDISGNIVEFSLGDITPGDQGIVVITVRILDTVAPGTGIIFTSVLGYKDRIGTQLATTSYMTVKVGRGDAPLSASFLGSIFGSANLLWSVALALLVLMGILTYGLVRIRRNGKNVMEDELGLGGIPATFEPIGPAVVRK